MPSTMDLSLVVAPPHSDDAQRAQREQELELLQRRIPNVPQERRLIHSCIDTLYPGAKFIGDQRSNRSSYAVEVEIKHVNMDEFYIAGYLRIKGLTEEFPDLATFFEAEIIGPKHSFITNKWDADEAVDRAHWSKFPSFKNVTIQDASALNPLTNNVIYMRWKEQFVLCDWKKKTILGASFAGFYYIVYDRSLRHLEGYYYHKNSEYFQRLNLKYCEERGFGGAFGVCFSLLATILTSFIAAYEFR